MAAPCNSPFKWKSSFESTFPFKWTFYSWKQLYINHLNEVITKCSLKKMHFKGTFLH